MGLAGLVFVTSTARLFVFPKTDVPRQADAIVMFAGSPGRLEKAVQLARAGYAPVLAVSVPAPDSPCPPPIPDVDVICFAPDPVTTQGEARWVGEAAAYYGWESIIVITVTSQTTRARIRLSRCYPGEVLMTPVPPPRRMWPYVIAYEWAAMAKAMIFEREC